MIISLLPNRAKATPVSTPEYFEGSVRMEPLVSPGGEGGLELLAVFFENGARTIPHVHSTDQVLLVTEGTCVLAGLDQHRKLVAGESAFIPAGLWHWHGAAPGTSMCHISIRKPGPTDWDVPKHAW